MSDQLEVKKLIIIGDGAIGKTCLLQVFQAGNFPDGYVPTVMGNEIKRMDHPLEEGKQFVMQLWDTAGQEEYKEARKLAYPGTHILLIGFSLTEPDSLANVESAWMVERDTFPDLKKAPVILVGLKSDLKNDEETKKKLAEKEKSVVTDEKAKAVARAIGAREYFETSAKSNTGVKEVFEAAARLAFEVPAQKRTKKCVII